MEVKLAYLAGLIDADGCVSLAKVGEGRRSPCLSFVNTSKELIDIFHKELGGYIFRKQHKYPQKPTYEIQIRKPETFILASEKLEPYLIYKKNKLLIAKEYALSILKYKGKKRTTDIKNERERIYSKWKSL